MKKYFRLGLGLVVMTIVAICLAIFNVDHGDGLIVASPFILAGFTEDQSKSFSEFMSKQAKDIQEKVKGLIDAAKHGELIKELTDMLKGDGKEEKGITALLPIMQKQLDDIATAQKNAKLEAIKKEVDSIDMIGAVKELLGREEFKTALKEGFSKKKVFELKVDSSVVTGDVNRTLQNLTLGFAPENQLAFIANMNQMFIGQDKNAVLWMDGAYTSNVGYVSEGTGQATADSGTAVEKTREMSKISAKLPLTAEMLEDFEYIANAFRSKMMEKSSLFTDGEAYDGDGSDGGEPKHIYGIKGHATAFNATTAGVALTVVEPNIGNLVDAMILQAEVANFRSTNVLWMNPKDFYRFRSTKDDNNLPIFIKEINGTFTISGLRVIKSNRVTAGDLLTADTSKLQYWTKRRPEIKFSQMNGTDFVDDAWTAVMFVRSQVVVETFDKLSLIFVDDIDAALTSLENV
jgi:HK97 family phage major capsid protein